MVSRIFSKNLMLDEGDNNPPRTYTIHCFRAFAQDDFPGNPVSKPIWTLTAADEFNRPGINLYL
jgi:hypothetical protein